MRIILADETIIDVNSECVVIVFDTDEERINMGSNLVNMQPKEHIRLYAVVPYNYNGDAKQLLDGSLKLLGYERGIEEFS